jgi:hypothetical protein
MQSARVVLLEQADGFAMHAPAVCANMTETLAREPTPIDAKLRGGIEPESFPRDFWM